MLLQPHDLLRPSWRLHGDEDSETAGLSKAELRLLLFNFFAQKWSLDSPFGHALALALRTPSIKHALFETTRDPLEPKLAGFRAAGQEHLGTLVEH